MDKKTNVRCEKCNGTGSYDVFNPVWLKFRRKELGITLRELGRRLGFTAQYLHDIEKGRRACPKVVGEFFNEELSNGEE